MPVTVCSVSRIDLVLLALVAHALDGRLEQQAARSVQAVHHSQHILRDHHVAALAHRCDRLVLRRRQRIRVEQLQHIRLEPAAGADAVADAAVGGRVLRGGHRERTTQSATCVRSDHQLDAVGNVDRPRKSCRTERPQTN